MTESIEESIQNKLMERLEEKLGFRPDPREAQPCIDMMKAEIAEKLVNLLSEGDVLAAAGEYGHPR